MDRTIYLHDDARLERIQRAIALVTDPEIPVLSVIDMGIIADVRIDADQVTIDVTPTFVGCPALDVIRQNIHAAVLDTGETNVKVNFVYHPPWTSDRITEAGREKLRQFGFAPPGRKSVMVPLLLSSGLPQNVQLPASTEPVGWPTASAVGESNQSVPLLLSSGLDSSTHSEQITLDDLTRVPCPFCGSTNTDLESLFGPTLCRSIHYCQSCLQSFEHFKNI